MGIPDPIKLVSIPKRWKNSHVVHLRHPGSRWYVERGPVFNLHWWIAELNKAFPENLIPYQWVADYVITSRTTVHNKAVSGGITVFSFEPEQSKAKRLGRKPKRQTYDFAVLSECEQWRCNLIEAAEEQLRERQE